MTSVAAEDGVLKLVRPGRNVEIYRKPVTAAEIMNKYPRHSVTRPDVFEYPWVVVRPESALNLGRVFFVVPNRTIYKLMKSFKEKKRDSPTQKMLTYQKDHCHDSTSAGSTPKHLARVNQSPPTSTTSCMWISKPDQNRDLRTKKQSKVGSWPDVGEKPKPVANSRIFLRSSDDDFESTDSKRTAEFCGGTLVKFQHRREVAVLKSCLRKPGTSRKLLQLRVSFYLPEENKSSREESKSLDSSQL